MMRFEKIGDSFHVHHPFNGLRMGVAGRNDSIDYTAGLPEIRSAERLLLSLATGLSACDFVFLNQIHGDDVILVTEKPAESGITIGDADAIITCVPGVCPVIRTADCLPVFLYDPDRHVLAAVHSGWKGTKLGIAGRTMRTMVSVFGCDVSSLFAFILPSIGPDSYQVQDDVAGYFTGYTREINGSLYLDLWKKVEDTLHEEGLPMENIFNTGVCNLTSRNDFYTHRGGDRGRNLNYSFFTL